MGSIESPSNLLFQLENCRCATLRHCRANHEKRDSMRIPRNGNSSLDRMQGGVLFSSTISSANPILSTWHGLTNLAGESALGVLMASWMCPAFKPRTPLLGRHCEGVWRSQGKASLWHRDRNPDPDRIELPWIRSHIELRVHLILRRYMLCDCELNSKFKILYMCACTQ